MLEEAARVVTITQGQIWVVGIANNGCAACMQKSSCGTAALNTVLKKKPVAVDSDLEVQVGDTVIVAIDESVLLRSAFVMYLLPVLALLIGAGIADKMFSHVVYADIWIAGSALLSLALALWLMRTIQSLSLLNYYPRPMVMKVVKS